MSDGSAFRAAFFMTALAIQVGVQPMVTRVFVGPEASKLSCVFGIETFKLATCIIGLNADGKLKEVLRSWDFKSSFLAAGLPASIYAIQSMFIQVAYQSLDSVVFNIMNQTKVMWTALFVYALCGRAQSWQQCVAICLLVSAAFLASDQVEKEASSGVEYQTGLVAILIASGMSGVAAALSELALRTWARNSYLFSAELSIYSMFVLIISLAMNVRGELDHAKSLGLFHDMTVWSAIPLCMQALGGVCIGQVTQYAGGVAKGFSLIAGIIIASVIRVVMSGQGLSLQLLLAIPIACASIWMHSSFPPPRLPTAKETETKKKK